MNSTSNISFLLFIITTILLYLAGIIAMIQSAMKYHYSKFWIVMALLLFVCPPFIFILMSLCEKTELKKQANDKKNMRAKIKVNIAVAIFIFYYLLFPLFFIVLKYSSINSEWYKEISLTCVNIVMIVLIPLYLYTKKKINSLDDLKINL